MTIRSGATRLSRTFTVAAAAFAVLVLSSCAANEMGLPPAGPDALSGTLNGSGASSQSSASDAWVASFQTDNPDATVNYSPDGSGAGRKAFISGGVQYAGSDSALSERELSETFSGCAAGGRGIDLPVYVSPIAVIFNIKGVENLNLDAATIAGIFKGTITRWNDPAVAALNPGTPLPAGTITAVHRSDDSGTTRNFTDYLGQVAPQVWDEPPDDSFPYQNGEAAQGTSGVVEAVGGGVNTIGYSDASRAGHLGIAKLNVGGSFVTLSTKAAAAVVAGSPLVEGRESNDIAVELDRKTTDSSHYPLVLVSYMIACDHYQDAATAKLVKAYLHHVVSSRGQAEAAKSAGSAPLSPELASRITAAIDSIR
ncbi:phosphate ABC transporter substrate-binding protein PstS [Parafrigoribacterium mesophilum]|uniref:phosphate ABC transporter substrate-binding protein PstS n=1 Tax=Parafrigoribacterium mesophilum TaxID=433646 RepID=UPI003D1580D3